MEGAKSSDISRVTIVHRPLPEEANHDGNVYGGNIMRHMDGVGAIAAVRHARGALLTAAVEYMSFRSPVRVDELMIFHAAVNAVWNSSMEVGIRTEAEDPYTGERRHVCTCYLTFVHVDANRQPARLPRLIPADEEARRRMADANRRMAFSRIEHRRKTPRLGALRISLLPGLYAICKLDRGAPLPDLSPLPPTAFVTLTRTDEERSLIIGMEAFTALTQGNPSLAVHADLACLKVSGKDTFPITGMLSSISTVLASAQVPLLVVSTFDSCYVLLQNTQLPTALEQLQNAGHIVDSL